LNIRWLFSRTWSLRLSGCGSNFGFLWKKLFLISFLEPLIDLLPVLLRIRHGEKSRWRSSFPHPRHRSGHGKIWWLSSSLTGWCKATYTNKFDSDHPRTSTRQWENRTSLQMYLKWKYVGDYKPPCCSCVAVQQLPTCWWRTGMWTAPKTRCWAQQSDRTGLPYRNCKESKRRMHSLW